MVGAGALQKLNYDDDGQFSSDVVKEDAPQKRNYDDGKLSSDVAKEDAPQKRHYDDGQFSSDRITPRDALSITLRDALMLRVNEKMWSFDVTID